MALGSLSLLGYSLSKNYGGGRVAVGKRFSVEFYDPWIYDFYFKDIVNLDVAEYPNDSDYVLINGILIKSSDVLIKDLN